MNRICYLEDLNKYDKTCRKQISLKIIDHLNTLFQIISEMERHDYSVFFIEKDVDYYVIFKKDMYND